MDKVIYSSHNGKLVKISPPLNETNANFVIVCTYGDWSGFRTLADCLSQRQELEDSMARKPNIEFQIVER